VSARARCPAAKQTVCGAFRAKKSTQVIRNILKFNCCKIIFLKFNQNIAHQCIKSTDKAVNLRYAATGITTAYITRVMYGGNYVVASDNRIVKCAHCVAIENLHPKVNRKSTLIGNGIPFNITVILMFPI